MRNMSERPLTRAEAAKRLRDALKEKGWTQEKLAGEIRIARTQVNQYARGKEGIGVTNGRKLARALGKPELWFVVPDNREELENGYRAALDSVRAELGGIAVALGALAEMVAADQQSDAATLERVEAVAAEQRWVRGLLEALGKSVDELRDTVQSLAGPSASRKAPKSSGRRT